MASEIFSGVEESLNTAVLFWSDSGGTSLENLSPTLDTSDLHKYQYLTC